MRQRHWADQFPNWDDEVDLPRNRRPSPPPLIEGHAERVGLRPVRRKASFARVAILFLLCGLAMPWVIMLGPLAIWAGLHALFYAR